MFKKTMLVSATLFIATSSVVHAEGIGYLGAGLGLGFANVYAHHSSPIGYMYYSERKYSPVVKGFGGYGWKLGVSKRYYLGGELNLDYTNFGGSAGGFYNVGVSAIPGYLVTQCTMIYGRVGLDRSFNPFSNIFNNGYDQGQYGLGVQTALTKTLDARAEYVYAGHYPAIKDYSQINLALLYKFGN